MITFNLKKLLLLYIVVCKFIPFLLVFVFGSVVMLNVLSYKIIELHVSRVVCFPNKFKRLKIYFYKPSKF